MSIYQYLYPLIILFLAFFSQKNYSQVIDTFEIHKHANVRSLNGKLDFREVVDHSHLMAHAGTHSFRRFVERTDPRNVVVTRSYFQFDLGSIPEHVEILEATLHLKTDYVALWWKDGHRKRGENITHIYRVLQPWNKMLINWENQAVYAEDQYVVLQESQRKYENYKVDMTDLISDIVHQPQHNYGFLFKLKNEEPQRRMIFASNTHENSSIHPKLVVKYRVSEESSFEQK